MGTSSPFHRGKALPCLRVFCGLVGWLSLYGCISCSEGRSLDIIQPNPTAQVISPDFPDTSNPIDISQFWYGPDGFLAVYDPFENRILRFDEHGRYLGTLAGAAGDDALAGGFGAMTTNRQGKFFIARGRGGVLEMDLATGARRTYEIPVSEEHEFHDLLVSRDGMFYLSSYGGNGTWSVLKYAPHRHALSILHEDASRRTPGENPLNFWVPRIAEDANGDILVPDLLKYRIWVYRRDGSLRRTVDRNTAPPMMKESDLLLRVAGYRFPLRHWVELPLELRCFPAVVAVLATQSGSKFVFTSYRERDSAKFRVDVWDASWHLRGHGYLYNALKLVPYQIAGDRLVAADLDGLGENEDRLDLSRFEAPSVPGRLLVFETPW